MEGAAASFNPYTLLDSNDPGDVIGKARSKEDKTAGKKPAAAGPWAPASKAMAASTPAKKKNKKKKPAAAAANQANGKGPAAKQNGAGKNGKNGANNGGAKNQQTGHSNGVTERR